MPRGLNKLSHQFCTCAELSWCRSVSWFSALVPKCPDIWSRLRHRCRSVPRQFGTTRSARLWLGLGLGTGWGLGFRDRDRVIARVRVSVKVSSGELNEFLRSRYLAMCSCARLAVHMAGRAVISTYIHFYYTDGWPCEYHRSNANPKPLF